MTQYFRNSIFLVLTCLIIVSCEREPGYGDSGSGEKDYKYFLLSALGSWPNTVHYMTATNDLSKGEMDITKEGDEINSKGTYSYIVKNGFIYNYKTDQGIFKKFKYTQDRLTTVKEVPFTYISDISSYVWIDDNTLVLIGETGDGQHIRYTVFNGSDLSIIRQGEIEGFEPFPNAYNFYTVGAVTYMDGDIYLQYSFRNGKWLTPEYYNFAVIDYKTFKVKHSAGDNRSSGVANGSPYFKTAFRKDNEAFYYACFPRVGAGTSKISLLRVLKGATSPDPGYQINLTDMVGNKTLETMIDYIGNNKMVVLYRDPALGNSYNGRYAIIDIETRQLVRVLEELPGDEPYEQGAFVQNKKLYIALNASKGGNYVWIYDLQTDKITKGMKLPDNISGFARFEKFYD
ncbi:hypothetical protein H3Z85_00305 [Chryseobacterium indologenes]|uniref:Uncharacterized protein n=1 Tax=Chryseobacterium indologenes TaxID=253 RepID=A0A4U8VJM3_CHRID|nr:hypothetical protein [Chryseobacterium indologenes]AZB20492.1 hypothetical protein EG352_08530 [Chryseobacterium indologenes]QPQ52009.1 hypothetical protein H3Z85_00305 [Chryseobacterium indologenes]TLX24406.1 hypothetical protein FE904_17210 [Chryseobacterium indologenes]SFI60464.1 hypothetical protein SAMN05421692_0200 [Chryseobacterium indologenes]SUX50585.1 Uncharacterised protein [Chryseobacterium indologenes]